MNNTNENNASPIKSGSRLLGVGLALGLALAAFFSGMEIGSSEKAVENQQAGLFSFLLPATRPDAGADLNEFWRVWNLLEKKFVNSTTSEALSRDEKIWGAISGLVNSYGDPYTVFLPPEDAAQFEDDISGNFGGVGMEVGIRKDLVTVIAPLADSPASKAGIVAGDVVIKIDETSTDGMGIDQAVRLIRGEKGTKVKLTIYREGETEFKEFDIVRDDIKVPTIKTEVVDGAYIIRLYNFNALADSMIIEALQEYQKGNHKKLILDLRGNPGGFLQSAVSISSYFLPAGKVVVRENFGPGVDEQIYRSQGKTRGDFNPDNFVVLIDGGSASAAEIVAGALSDHGAATTIGEPTFGKGSVQELVSLPSGASLKVTVARWLTPNGVSFSDGGLKPDVLVKRTPQQIIAGEDPQQAAALEWLKGNRDIGEKKAFSEMLVKPIN